MKKIILTVIAAAISCCIAYPQPCLPEGITFTTQEQIDNFQINYPGCTDIEGDVIISDNYTGNISNLNGLNVLISFGGLSIENNTLLTSLNGLESITSINYDLWIEDNDALINLSGLGNLTFIGGSLNIEDNSSLTSLDGLGNLITIGSSLRINNNINLTDLNALQNLNVIGISLFIDNNDGLTSLTGLENLTSVEGNVSVKNNDGLTSLTGLNNLASTGANLELSNNPSLINLNGLENVTSVFGDLMIVLNFNLSNLSGLNNIITIEGKLEITGNSSLISINDLLNLSSITNGLKIFNNPNLINLTGLCNLASIGGDLNISNNETLTSLTGMDSIEFNSITNLYIFNNSNLSNCDVLSICEYLTNPNGITSIFNNAPGCNSPEEVEAHCLTPVVEIKTVNEITIIPNPSSDKITISFIAFTEITQLSIFTISAEKVIERQLTDTETQIDISALPRGLYFVRVQDEKMVQVKKIIKK